MRWICHCGADEDKGETMRKKILKIIGVVLLLIILAAAFLVVTAYQNPGFYLRLVSDKISEDQTVEASYNYDFDNLSEIKTTPFYYFTPSESGNYTFSVEDIESSSEVRLTMSVTDKYLDDYFVTDNRWRNGKENKNTISGSAALQASKPCYVLFTADPIDEDLAQFSGSFKLTVTKAPDDDGPPRLTTDEPVTVRVDAEGQACAAFTPDETGYYRFENSIVSHDSSKGYSSLSSITASNNIKVGLTNDICMLLKDQEYYIWVTANETDSRTSVIKLSCMPLKTVKASGICSVDLDGDSMIEYVAKKDCNLAVYTVSGGDPKLVIYEKAGFPLRTDDRSEVSLSDNPDDVATVLRVKAETGLHISIFGDVSDCRVFITEYKGDGISFTADDLVPIPDKKAGTTEESKEPEAAEQPEQSGQNP